MQTKEVQKRVKTYFLIVNLILSVIAFNFLISPVLAQEETWPAFNVCCEKTKPPRAAWCQNTLEENCASGFRQTPTSCEATSFCKPGCCYDSQEGLCMENTPQKVCNDNDGTWLDDEECNIKQCELGCCVLGIQASFVTLTRCKRLSGLFGLETNFRIDIGDETECLAIAASRDQGACVYEEEFMRGCKFTTRGDCQGIQSTGNMSEPEFYKDYLCSAEELATECGPTSNTMCVEGKDEVYFKDSCGNPANIYDASKLNDKAYWKKVIDKSKVCGAGSASGNAGSKDCGNCDYFHGSICSKGAATHGNYICKDLNCYDTLNGDDYKNGESWCEYEGDVGEGRDAVGSRQFRHVCIYGEETIEPCADFRNEACIGGEIEADGEVFREAACRVNRWTDCIDQDEDEDCLNTDKRDCYWIGGKDEVCVPDVPPGLKFWTEGDAESICKLGNSQCVVEYENKLLGSRKCVNNCECLEESWVQERNNICVALGDCGAYINIAGKFTDDGAEWKVDGNKKTISQGFLGSLRPVVMAGTLISQSPQNPISKWFEKLGVATGLAVVSSSALLSSLLGLRSSGESGGNKPTQQPIKAHAGPIGLGGARELTTFKTPFDSTVSFNVEGVRKTQDFTQIKSINKGTGEVAHAGGTTTIPPEAAQELSTYGQGIKPECTGLACEVNDLFSSVIINNLLSSAMIGGVFALVGGFIGGNGAEAGFFAGFGGTMAYYIMSRPGEYPIIGDLVTGIFGKQGFLGLGPKAFGIGVGALIFVLMWKETETEIVEFNCLPWQPPVGGDDCELCNKNEMIGCSEYRCKSLGQACDLLNAGTEQEACTWVNPRDVTSPKISVGNILEGYKWTPDNVVRPPAAGVVISEIDNSCVEPFTALEFDLITDEPAQCKIDYNLTRGFEEMSYFVGGTDLFIYNHTETLSLPGPDAINKVAPELQNDGTYTLYARCQDANGNFNQDAFSIRFCVEAGPDTTPPRIVDVSVSGGSPIQYNQTSLDLEVYVNEPAECKWSREDRIFDNMEQEMSCSTRLWEMNNRNVYTCKTTLTGIEDRKENDYYFRCKDQPDKAEGDRNVNTQSYLYKIIGTQPLNILEIEPNGTIYGSTDVIPVFLKVETDNGYDNGKAFCYYSTTGEEVDYIQFAETDAREHIQRQDLVTGDYTYYYKCVDLGGNAAYNSTEFRVETDRTAPVIVRVYKEDGLKIITNEASTCGYSITDCNFNIEDGIDMPYPDQTEHAADWKTSQNYYIRCKDGYGNQPNPNACSMIVRPYGKSEVIEL